MRRSISQQSVQELGGHGSVLARQRADHARLSKLLASLRSAEPGRAQDEVLRRIYRLVFTHAFAEESVLWPALRRALPDGEALTLEVEREHQEITEVVSALERSRSGDSDRPALIERAITLLDADVRDEEDELLPRLQDVLTPRDLRRLGRQWDLVRRIAPTRPHAVVSRRPPGNVIAALPLTIIDRSRDACDSVAERTPRPVAPVARVVSRSLGRVAGAVEHLPPLRLGERASTRR